ncbi:amino acid ABC transporter permease [Salmonella enterica subsp. enterica]|uniref:Amino acid ABC transporter permease n=1 Tax=Salmonella enterica I TaxID=59201 RepID=A0A379VQS2_SALET|nr:amino acid ABC transporter permease [Salmonella enterica subsp. enterica]
MIAGWSLFFNDLTEQLPLVVDGIKETCKLALIVSITGFLWGIIIFFLSLSHRPVVKAITRLYMDFFYRYATHSYSVCYLLWFTSIWHSPCPLLPWRLQGLP